MLCKTTSLPRPSLQVMKDATQSEDELKYSRKRRAQELPAFVDASDSEDESGSTDSKETGVTTYVEPFCAIGMLHI